MADAFDNILGQPKVRDLLRKSVRNERTTHAYLFCGPAGSNKTQSAYALAQALLCPKPAKEPKGSICGQCENCTRIKRKSHPDVHFLAPEGANGYLMEQIREIVSDVSFAPIQADKKVYIIDRVDMMGTSVANAFLKTLEEPPDNVVFILLGRTRDSVLPTIVSRCQIVPFRHIPPSEAAGIIAQNTGASLEQSREAMEACSGSISAAIGFLKASGNDRWAYRQWLLSRLAQIDAMDDWDIVSFGGELADRCKTMRDAAMSAQEAQLKADSEFLGKSAIRRIEERNKRSLGAQALRFLHQTVAIMESFLRDVMMACAGTPELIINQDLTDDIVRLSECSDIAKVSAGLAAIRHSEEALDYNVSPETCLDVLLFEVREVFVC